MNHQYQQGFSLLEVVLTIAILMTLVVAVAAMMRAGFDVRQGLSDRARTIHRLTVSMEKLANDVQHAFFVTPKDADRNGIDRTMKTIFKLEKAGLAGDKLSITTETHRPMVAGANESDFTFVVYQLRDSKAAAGRKDLYRAETPVIPLDLKEEVPMRLLASGIKTLNVECWNGDRWSKDGWDTGRSETRNVLPRLVRLTVEAWVHERTDGDGQDPTMADDQTEKLVTVIYLAHGGDFPELKEGDKSIKWGTL